MPAKTILRVVTRIVRSLIGIARSLIPVVACAACLPPIARDADNAIDLRYRMHPPASTVVAIYRVAGDDAPSRCKMVPTDSQAFAIRAESCGGLRAFYWGMSRVLLEQANSGKFATAIRLDDRTRWIDLPGPCE